MVVVVVKRGRGWGVYGEYGSYDELVFIWFGFGDICEFSVDCGGDVFCDGEWDGCVWKWVYEW